MTQTRQRRTGGESAVVRAPHDGSENGVYPLAGPEEVRAAPTGKGRLALTRRFPLSPIVGITPFNFPVQLAANKIAPAMPVALRSPSSRRRRIP